MPTEWTYHADGVDTAVSTEHELDGTLKTVTVNLDSFRVREWETKSEIEDAGKTGLHYDEEKGVYEEYGDGSNATIAFDVDAEGRALLTDFKPEDGDSIQPRHMVLLVAAERIAEHLDGVKAAFTYSVLRNQYEGAVDSGVVIERLET